MSDIVKAEPFDPNDGKTASGRTSSMLLPMPLEDQPVPSVRSAAEYAHILVRLSEQGVVPVSDPYAASAKAKKPSPPSAFGSNYIAYLPDPQSSGVIEWPGMEPEMLKKISREFVAPQMIINMRCADVLRYSKLSTQSWQPGWRIELMEGSRAPNKSELKDIRAAELFLANSCRDIPLDDALERDKRGYSSFPDFLSMATRETLTYAALGLWKDTDFDGKVIAYALLPTANIRLTGMQEADGKMKVGGYDGDPDIATALVSDTHEVLKVFRRDELTFFPRNKRPDVDIFGYGWPEIEQAIRIIQGFQNALDMNMDTFTKSAIPNGILVITGGQVTQKQLNLLNRMWTDLKRGVTKNWALPVISLNAESELSILDMSRMKGNEGYYKEFINMLAGVLCVLWVFPINRLGYHTSGTNRDSQPLPDSSTTEVDADDPGLSPLLGHLEDLINQYLLWTNWPHLRFSFSGKDPKQDARRYEARRNSMTLRESRAENDIPPLQEAYKGQDPEIELAAKLMDMAPIDPNMAGIFQVIAAAIVSIVLAPEKPAANETAAGVTPKPNARMTSKKDPAESEAHGGVSGVRRRSRAEGKTKA